MQPPTRFSVCFCLSKIIRNIFIIKPQEQQPGGFRQVRLCNDCLFAVLFAVSIAQTPALELGEERMDCLSMPVF